MLVLEIDLTPCPFDSKQATIQNIILISLLRNTWDILEKYSEVVVLLRNTAFLLRIHTIVFKVYIKGAVCNSIHFEFYFMH